MNSPGQDVWSIPIQLQAWKKLDGNHIVMFVLWPFLSLFYAIKNYRTPFAMNLVWLFCGYFGFTFVVAEGSFADSSRIAMKLVEMRNNGMTFSQLWSSFYNPATGNDIDIVQGLITFFVSKFTGDPRILYAFFGLFFGYFYTRNIWFLINHSYLKLNRFSTLLIVTFSVVIGIWDINGFRYYTAAQVFLYGVLPYIIEGNKKKIGFIIFSLLIHWSFFLAVAIFFIYILIKNRVHLYYILFVISFFISLLNLEIIRNIFENYAPGIVQETRASYLTEEYTKGIKETEKITNWYVHGHREVLRWFIFIFLSFLYFKQLLNLRRNNSFFKLLNFTLLFFIFVNTFNVVASVGRFYAVGFMLSLAVFFLYYQNNMLRIPFWMVNAGIPALLFFVMVRIRIGFDYFGLLTFIGNPFMAIFFKDNTPFIDYVKMIF